MRLENLLYCIIVVVKNDVVWVWICLERINSVISIRVFFFECKILKENW